MTDPAIEAAREAFLSAIPEETPDVEAPADPVEPQVAAEPATEAPPEVPEQPAKEPEARAYRKLLDGEKKLREQQAAFEAQRVAHEAELAAYRAVKDKVKTDPVAYLRAAGLSEAEIIEVVQEAQARDMGKLAPPEVRAQLAAKEAARIAREAQEKLEQRLLEESTKAQQAKAQEFVQQYQTGITNFVSSELTAYPELAKVHAAGKPVAQAMWQTATELAATRDPNGPAPTYAEVAAALNAQLAELASVIAPAQPPTAAVPPVAPTAPTPGKPVLRNSITQAQPSSAPEPEPKTYEELVAAVRQKAYAVNGLKF